MQAVVTRTTYLQVQEHYQHNMGHFAKIDENNIVIDVVKVPEDQDYRGEAYMHEIGFPGRYVQTSYNTFGNEHLFGDTPLRGNYAGIGHVYDPDLDVFYRPRPNEDVSLNLTTYQWEYPIPYPTGLAEYQYAKWNTETKSWDIKEIDNVPHHVRGL